MTFNFSSRKSLEFRKKSSTNYLYADKDKGGLGLTSIKSEYALQSIVGAYRMLISPNKEVSKTLQLNLRQAATKHKQLQNLSNLDVALDWLNQGDNAGGFNN